MDVRTVWGAREGCQRDGSAGGQVEVQPRVEGRANKWVLWFETL